MWFSRKTDFKTDRLELSISVYGRCPTISNMVLHFIGVFTVYKGLKRFLDKKIHFFKL